MPNELFVRSRMKPASGEENERRAGHPAYEYVRDLRTEKFLGIRRICRLSAFFIFRFPPTSRGMWRVLGFTCVPRVGPTYGLRVRLWGYTSEGSLSSREKTEKKIMSIQGPEERDKHERGLCKRRF